MQTLTEKRHRPQLKPTRSSSSAQAGQKHQSNPVLDLQRSVGNQAVQRLFNGNHSNTRPDTDSLTHSAGTSLDSGIRAQFERRIGETVGDVRIHRGPEVDKALRAQGALAAAAGNQIAVSNGVPSPETHEGRSVLEHELVHVAQQKNARGPVSEHIDFEAEQQARNFTKPVPELQSPLRRVSQPSVMFLTAASGQHVDAASSGGLTADLTSPIVTGRTVHFQFDVSPTASYTPATTLASPYPSYQWKVTDRDTGATVASATSATNEREIVYPRAGHFRVECVLTDPRKGKTPPVTLDQDVVDEDPKLAGSLDPDSDLAEAERELVDDLRAYVNDAATATGPQGITPRFLAAILRQEIANTNPTPSFVPFRDTNKESRTSELSGVDAAIKKKASGATVNMNDIDHSVGVAQVKLSTAAMHKGLIPWTEANPVNKQPARATIATNFAALPTTSLSDLHALLAWPKSNIKTAADLLARLKNRPNRYPTMGRASFGVDQRACEIVATEYNIGPTTSAEPAAVASSYGKDIWSFMSVALIKKVFPNT